MTRQPRLSPSRLSAVALTVALSAALAACNRADDSAARTDPPPSSPAAPAGNLQQDAARVGAEVRQEAREANRDMAAAGQEMKADAARAADSVQQGAERAAGALDDAAITAGIKTRLAADSQLSALRIDVDTRDGQVTLTGPAPSQAAKDHATTLARQSDGVKGVTNNLTVQQ